MLGITSLKIGELDAFHAAYPSDWIAQNLKIAIYPTSKKNIAASPQKSKEIKTYQKKHVEDNSPQLIKIGVYGEDNIGIYSINNVCFYYFYGKDIKGKLINSAIYSPLENQLYFFPNIIHPDDALNIFANYYISKKTKIVKTSSTIYFNNYPYALYGFKLPDKDIEIYFISFNKDITTILIRGSYFNVKFKMNGYVHEIYYGLYGFNDATNAYIKYCK